MDHRFVGQEGGERRGKERREGERRGGEERGDLGTKDQTLGGESLIFSPCVTPLDIVHNYLHVKPGIMPYYHTVR